MKKVTFAFLGMGNRGINYSSKMFRFPEEMEVVAMADLRRDRLETANKQFNLPEDRLFDSAEALLAQPKMADILVVASQDQQHRDHAIAAMEAGYDLLLEKPIAAKLEDIVEIAETAKRLGRRVLVCHVLRYTVFYKEIRRLINEGVIGTVQSVEASENVGYYHYAHSYIRGNWHNTEKSSPMILAKCSHDMDILQWITGKKCLKLNSFGNLNYFNAAHAPEGSAERCLDCKVENCPFNAPDYYIPRIGKSIHPRVLHPEPTPENITEALRTSDYGKCVFHMDNDVVDHQTMNMLMEDGVTITFQMCGFTNLFTRGIRVMGTEGELWGNFKKRELYFQRWGEEEQRIDLEALCEDFSGHGGGDAGMIHDVIRLYRGDDFDTSSITYLEDSVDSHYMAFAAEKSRLAGGELVMMDEFVKGLTE